MKNLLTLFVLVFTFSITGLAQTVSAESRAAQQTEELNNLITSIYSDVTLSAEQRIAVQNLFVKRIEQSREIKADETLTEQEKSARIIVLRADIAKELHKKILTSEQRRAKRKAKEQGLTLEDN